MAPSVTSRSATRGDCARFSVIVRVRQGTGSSLSTVGIILEIQNHLKPYKCICNVALSYPNFIIHLPTVDLQLQILACKTFTGEDYVLDILPWCSEYATFELPWIIKSVHADAGPSTETYDNSTQTVNLQPNLVMQHVPSQFSEELGSSTNQAHFRGKRISVAAHAVPCQLSSDITVDFSYFVIVELKEFYAKKFQAFKICEQTCREIYGVATVFSSEMDKAVKFIQEETRLYEAVPPGDTLHHIATFGGDLNNPLWFISEEVFSLTMSMNCKFGTGKPPVDVTRFSIHENNEELPLSATSMTTLRSIAETMVARIYGRTLLVATAKDYAENFSTQVWSACFYYEYKTPKPMTQQQAQASAIYRFLKYMTNVLGYRIQDANSDVLFSMVSDLVCLEASISELQVQINKAVTMIQSVHDDIKELHNCIPTEISQPELSTLNNKIKDLFTLLQEYSDAINNGADTFECHKQAFKSIKFESIYAANPDVM